MPEQIESSFAKFLRMYPNYPNESTANVLLFQWIKDHGGNAFTYDSFVAGWTAPREELIQTVSSLNAETFLNECPEYPGGSFNAELLLAHIRTQVGSDRVWSKENYFSAYEYLKSKGMFATEVEYTETEKAPAPLHPAQALADAMTQREAEEAKLRKLSPIGKPVSKKLRNLAVQERRRNIEPQRLRRQDQTPEHVQI
jgi:hypothetical protein